MREDEAIDLVKKVKRKRPDKAEEWKIHAEPGEIGRDVLNALALFEMPPINTDDNEQVTKRVSEYFNLCVERDMKPSFVGLAAALGVDRMTLYRWVNGATPSKPRAVCDTLKRAHIVLNQMIENWMQTGKINPVSGIFLMKNNFGYADKSEVVLTPNNPLGDQKDRSEIEARYRDSIAAPDGEPTFVELPAETPEVEGVFSEGEGNDTI